MSRSELTPNDQVVPGPGPLSTSGPGFILIRDAAVPGMLDDRDPVASSGECAGTMPIWLRIEEHSDDNARRAGIG